MPYTNSDLGMFFASCKAHRWVSILRYEAHQKKGENGITILKAPTNQGEITGENT